MRVIKNMQPINWKYPSRNLKNSLYKRHRKRETNDDNKSLITKSVNLKNKATENEGKTILNNENP